MAYRRRQGGMSRSSTFKEEKNPPPDEGEWTASSSLAAQAIAASAAHRHSKGGGPTYDYTSMGSSNETGSFWGVLARKAKAILEDDNIVNTQPSADHHHLLTPTQPRRLLDSSYSPRPTTHPHHQAQLSYKKVDDTPALPTAATLTCSMRDTIGKTLEEGLITPAAAENIKPPETQTQTHRKIQIVRKGVINEGYELTSDQQQHMMKSKNLTTTTQEDQLKASRDVAMATAAKAKLLLRELKTVKADLAFAKQRCSQLEEENKILRDAREKGVNPADDDMIRNQLETLLAEKTRLAQENSVYARENRVLREIVEYHQLTMQDVIYLDDEEEEEEEGTDDHDQEVAEAYPIFSASLPDSPTSPPHISLFRSASATAQMRFEPAAAAPSSSPSSKTTASSSIPRPAPHY